MKKAAIPIESLLLIPGLLVHAYAAFILLWAEGISYMTGTVLCLSLFSSLIKCVTNKKRLFAFLIFFHPFLLYYFLINFTDRPLLIFVLTALLVVEGSLYLDIPWSLLAASYPVLLQLVSFKFWYMPPGGGESESLFALQYFPALTLLCLTSVMSIHYREALIRSEDEIATLKETLIKLNRANRDFQDSLFRISSESAESERKRITRDIHDLVGYTMTNNIVLMEMATDLMKSDPLEVSRLINTARKNAQDGLNKIRSILYEYRKESSYKSEGLQAVGRQIDVFQTAAQIRIYLNLGNCPLSFDWDTDSTIYHMIQEAMLNAYCHGRAKRIDIFLSLSEGKVVKIDIQDDGVGAQAHKEGIGIKGMRERLALLGGTLRYGNNGMGFRICGEIPLADKERTGAGT